MSAQIFQLLPVSLTEASAYVCVWVCLGVCVGCWWFCNKEHLMILEKVLTDINICNHKLHHASHLVLICYKRSGIPGKSLCALFYWHLCTYVCTYICACVCFLNNRDRGSTFLCFQSWILSIFGSLTFLWHRWNSSSLPALLCDLWVWHFTLSLLCVWVCATLLLTGGIEWKKHVF